MTIVIDKHIPLPQRKKSERAEKYPIRALEVGHSFYAPIKPAGLATHARRIAKETATKFVVRAEGEGSRVWRSK